MFNSADVNISVDAPHAWFDQLFSLNSSGGSSAADLVSETYTDAYRENYRNTSSVSEAVKEACQRSASPVQCGALGGIWQ